MENSNSAIENAADVTYAAQETATYADSGIHIALAAEQVGVFFGVPITNTLITSWIIMLLLAIIAFFVGRNLRVIPGRIQTFFEEMLSFMLGYMGEVLEDTKLARKLFPLIATLFLFIALSNLLEFTPGIGSLGFVESTRDGEVFTSVLRSVNTDLNVTLALAVIAFLSIEIVGVATLGTLTYASKFFNFKSVLGFLVGIIELFSEFARLISFSFRLFGNILAGEVLIVVIASFVPLFLPVPMMLFEVFVGLIQAAIFALLTLFFVKIAITKPH
ncbi:MAG: ATP synthase F0 subunit A [Parcubacteria group bacterium]|nr:ATP synthase F0 subunit A [Parcubacteria group bacterium]|tara:strand:+ start:6822 stop:7643 length:822 start_codon:yes stop_codon:yes gene_type:complete